MPDRIIRDEIVDSDKWIDLRRNTYRLAFIVCVLHADDFGNLEATEGALWRLWRDPLALTDRQAVPEILSALADSGLIRLYDVERKRYAHIPKFRQRLRAYKRAHPRPPATIECNEIKEITAHLSDTSRTHDGQMTVTCQSPAGEVKGSEVKGIEEKRSRAEPNAKLSTGPQTAIAPNVAVVKTLPATQTNGQNWKSLAWVNATGKTLGVEPRSGESAESYKDRVYAEVQHRRTG